MSSYTRDNFKIRFEPQPSFYVNEKKGVVVCKVRGSLQCPYDEGIWGRLSFSKPQIDGISLTGTGIAKCHESDEFDVNRGKRIALARAENECYLAAIRYLNEQAYNLQFLMTAIDEFVDKGFSCCAHNDDYVDSLVFTEHPMYKKEILAPKRGIEVSTIKK